MMIAKTTTVPKTGKSKNVIIPLNCSISLVSLFIIQLLLFTRFIKITRLLGNVHCVLRFYIHSNSKPLEIHIRFVFIFEDFMKFLKIGFILF